MVRSNARKLLIRVASVVIAMSMLVVSVPSTIAKETALTASDYQKQLRDLQKKQEELEQKASKIKDSLSEEKKKQESLLVQIDNVKQQLDSYQGQIDLLNTDITAKRKEISDKNAEIGKKNKEITQQQKVIQASEKKFERRLEAMYMAGDTSALNIIFGARSFSDFLTRSEMLKSISQNDQALITQFANQKKELEAMKSNIEKAKAEVEASLAAVEQSKVEIETLQGGYQQKSDELNALHKQTQDAVSDLTGQQHGIEKESQDYSKQETEIANAIAQTQNNSGSGNQQGGGIPPAPSASGYTWPVPGYRYISSYFGDTDGRDGGHGGLDIAASAGTPIYAARGGTVIIASAGTWGGGYGTYVLIDHHDGYYTLYSHCLSLNVSQGQDVSSGQQIAQVGSTGNSSGNHCHFEVRKGTVRLNPLNFVTAPR